MFPLIDPPLFESIAVGLVWLAALGMIGTMAVVALVASDRPRPSPRALVTSLPRRLPEAA